MGSLSVNRSPILRFLSESQIRQIHLATLEVLEKTGVEVYAKEALDLFRKAGVAVTNKTRVRIPSYLVEEAIHSAPQRVVVANRRGKRTMFLEDHRVYFGTGSDCPYILDPWTNERRQVRRKDVENAAMLCDYLSNIDFVMSLGLISDIPAEDSDVYQFEAMISNTEKPIVFTAHNKDGVADIIEIAAIIAGSLEELNLAPFIVYYGQPSSPLRHSQESIEKLLLCSEKKIPIVYAGGGLAGATAPTTLAGAIVVNNAEVLSALVISQLKQKGSPFIYGGGAGIIDMSTGIQPLGNPESRLSVAVASEISSYYKLPAFSTAGCSDAKVLDQQAGIEAAYTILLAALSGANLIHDVGFLESALTASYDMVVMCDEIIGLAKRVVENVKVTKETIALDIIDEVGPGGSFLGEDHTLRHFREEFWFPKLMDRQIYANWKQKGEKTLGQRINEEVRRILEEYSAPCLSQDVRNKYKKYLRSRKPKGGIHKR